MYESPIFIFFLSWCNFDLHAIWYFKSNADFMNISYVIPHLKEFCFILVHNRSLNLVYVSLNYSVIL